MRTRARPSLTVRSAGDATPMALSELQTWLDAHPGATARVHAVAGAYFVRVDDGVALGRGARLTIAEAVADACAAYERNVTRNVTQVLR